MHNVRNNRLVVNFSICTHTVHAPSCHFVQDGFFPLHNASQEGHGGIVKMLLKAEATVDLQTKVEDCYYHCHL